ncbi:MAG: 2Fe-2S iron-sulfur cluster-binding protein, partial [Gemmatimonadales bacterium]
MRRLPVGGLVDRERLLRFEWDGRPLTGLVGDTVASALLANGIQVLGSSVTGRPRGVMSAGAEEATGFGQLGDGTVSEPLVRLTGAELADGLVGTGLTVRGRLEPDGGRGRFDKRFAFADVVIVGAGPAGLAAALAAGRTGRRVLLVEQDFVLGGGLRRDPEPIDAIAADRWIAAAAAELAALPEATMLRRTTAVTMLDGNGLILVQRFGGTEI